MNIKDKCFFVIYRSFWEDVNNGNWEPSTFCIFDKFIDQEHSFIDIGAWIGPTVLYGSQIAKKCYAIEPDPVALIELNENIKLNPNLKAKINIYDFCINDVCGKVRLGNNNNFGDSMSSILINDEEKSLLVKCLTLQEFILQNKIFDCNFIKMDIEGAEYIILPQLKEFLKLNKPTMHLSLHPSLYNKNIINYATLIFENINFYKNIYDHKGISLNAKDIFMDFLVRSRKGVNIVVTDKCADIVVTDKSWNG